MILSLSKCKGPSKSSSKDSPNDSTNLFFPPFPPFFFTFLVVALVVLSSCENVNSDSSFIEDANAPENESPASLNSAPPSISQNVPTTSNIPTPSPSIAEGCGDGVCQPAETKCTCVSDCGECRGDASATSEFRCVEGKCKIVAKQNVCQNGACDPGETPSSCPSDCPICEPDNNPCTKDSYDYSVKACTHEPIIPCCGNGVCEPPGESGSCLVDCKESKITLANYPAPFVVNKKVNTLIVVGSQGTGADVAAGIDIIRGWEFNGSNQGYDAKAKLDKEVDSLQGKNAILIGNACENSFVASLMKPVRDCHDGLEQGVGLLRLYQTGPDSYAIVIAGFGSEEIRHAAKVLEKYQDYGIKGFQVEVR